MGSPTRVWPSFIVERLDLVITQLVERHLLLTLPLWRTWTV